jgi:hypothetical protein
VTAAGSPEKQGHGPRCATGEHEGVRPEKYNGEMLSSVRAEDAGIMRRFLVNAKTFSSFLCE